MSLLSDSKGNMSYFDMGNVSVLEASSYTLFSIMSLVGFTNFAVQIPTSTTSTVSLSTQAFSFGLPFLGTGVYSWAMVILLGLLLFQVYDASTSRGRSDKFQPKKWVNSIPTGLTILLIGSVVTVVAQVYSISAIMSLINTNLWTQFFTVTAHSAMYYALSSQ